MLRLEAVKESIRHLSLSTSDFHARDFSTLRRGSRFGLFPLLCYAAGDARFAFVHPVPHAVSSLC